MARSQGRQRQPSSWDARIHRCLDHRTRYVSHPVAYRARGSGAVRWFGLFAEGYDLLRRSYSWVWRGGKTAFLPCKDDIGEDPEPDDSPVIYAAHGVEMGVQAALLHTAAGNMQHRATPASGKQITRLPSLGFLYNRHVLILDSACHESCGNSTSKASSKQGKTRCHARVQHLIRRVRSAIGT